MTFYGAMAVPKYLNELLAVLRGNGLRPDDGKRFMASRTITDSDSPYDIADDDCFILADTSDGDVTVNMPPSASSQNRMVVIKKGESANTLYIARDGSDLFQGGSGPISITTQYEHRFFVCHGTTWYVLSRDT